MPMNPIAYTEKVVSDFLKYQLTAYAFADPRLHAQMRESLSLDRSRDTPLLKGPFVSLSRAFRTGAAVRDFVAAGILHPHMEKLIPYPHLYGHQEKAIRAIGAGRTTLVSTGTGSGKTECFLYPVISRGLELRDRKADPGILAVFVYPMNALAEDQLGRLRELLAGTGLTFGMYVGKTPRRSADVSGVRLAAGSSRDDYRAALEKARAEKVNTAVHPPEELCSRDEMQESPPRILLTNVKELELLLTRQKDIEMFRGARLEFLVFDEAHTYGGAAGAETACLIRRLRAFCGRKPEETVCIGTSATLVDAERGPDAGKEFASRFFGVAADGVAVVGEEYQNDDWAAERRLPAAPGGDTAEHLRRILTSVEDGASPVDLSSAWERFTGSSLPAGGGRPQAEQLYDRLAANELCFQLAEALQQPQPIRDLSKNLSEAVGREVSEVEILCWLALGAASRREGRPLLRPVLHAFLSGISGAVVTFPEDRDGPKLWLSADEEVEQEQNRLVRLPLTTCNGCGQHYFIHSVKDLRITSRGLEGGDAAGGGTRAFWPPLAQGQEGACRVVLLDGLVGEEDEDEVRHTFDVFLCRYCGALHPGEIASCDGCGRPNAFVGLLAAEQKEDNPGFLTSCVACGTNGRSFGGGYREPARPVRAVTVSDVHVVAQNMIHRAERRRLLVFADNRQDAAFQAGWMADHARRYRLRALMAEHIGNGASIGDLVARLDRLLDADDDLSRALIPEVWAVQRKERAGQQHTQQRRQFLRIAVLRELATNPKQRIGLEAWGRIQVHYLGLEADLAFAREWAGIAATTPDRLVDGIAALLDHFRRSSMTLLDREGRIFSRAWFDGDPEVQNGYLPMLRGVPKGLRLQRSPSNDKARVTQWIGTHPTFASEAAHAFGIPRERAHEFLARLWELLRDDLGILIPVELRGGRGNVLPHSEGTHQIDGDVITIVPHRNRWRCRRCRRSTTRPTPHDRCLAWRCDGTLEHVPDDPDNYDLSVLEEGFAMLRPAEHSAQVPGERREQLERAFKGDGESVNTLVCTPTLEMGVDIGGLDTVLLRNVPPLPANYWQRVGRAGRRHRLAVNLTYARPVSHDRAYFDEPMKLLAGRVDPPRFNLKNEVMLAKHVHAAVITRLYQLARGDTGLDEPARQEINGALAESFPVWVRDYLFDSGGMVRGDAFQAGLLDAVVRQHLDDLVGEIDRVFRATWPEADLEILDNDRLRAVVAGIPEALEQAVRSVRKRLDWAMEQMRQLDDARRMRGTLDSDEDALHRRCDRLVKRLKGTADFDRTKASGYDDRYAYAVLATEGFLPGYGLESGSILGTALVPPTVGTEGEFPLPRPPAVALREYVPGNLIYANGRRFIPRQYKLGTDDLLTFQVDRAREAIREIGTAAAGGTASIAGEPLNCVAICDVDLTHVSHISDDEEYRFQMPVAVYGNEQNRHGGGHRFDWGGRFVDLRRNVYLRLVNIGPASKIEKGLGYPMSLVTGQTRSPFASDAERKHFTERETERHGKPIREVGFYADVIADALSLPDCGDRAEAYSLIEALRMGMARVLEMEREDLQVLVIGQVGQDGVHALLYDPMPGGSGLLQQACERWEEVITAALEVVEGCPAVCEKSCIDCLQTFRNAYFHRHLDRNVAAERLRAWGTSLVEAHPIPARLQDGEPRSQEIPVNEAERRLRDHLQRAHFPEGEWQKPIDLGPGLGTTRPDVFFPDDEGRGVCVYLDGMSEHIHGNARTQARDRQIRTTLRNREYEVVAITATELWDRDAMTERLAKLARYIDGKARANEVRKDTNWYAEEAPPTGNGSKEYARSDEERPIAAEGHEKT